MKSRATLAVLAALAILGACNGSTTGPEPRAAGDAAFDGGSISTSGGATSPPDTTGRGGSISTSGG